MSLDPGFWILMLCLMIRLFMIRQAMDKLLREHIEDMDTRVIDRSTQVGESNAVIPIMPNTGGISGSRTPVYPIGMSSQGANVPWLDDMDEVERMFYHNGMREGATLALAKVRDEDAERVRGLMRQYGARTYVKD